MDWSRKVAKYLVTKAKKMEAVIAVEELEKLWHSALQKSSTLADRLSRFAYRKLLQAIEAKAVEHNAPMIHVDPRNTSKKCPRCGTQLSCHHKLAICSRYNLKADRNTVGAMNIYKRAPSRSPAPGVARYPPNDG